jgi:hypothetical protein
VQLVGHAQLLTGVDSVLDLADSMGERYGRMASDARASARKRIAVRIIVDKTGQLGPFEARRSLLTR